MSLDRNDYRYVSALATSITKFALIPLGVGLIAGYLVGAAVPFAVAGFVLGVLFAALVTSVLLREEMHSIAEASMTAVITALFEHFETDGLDIDAQRFQRECTLRARQLLKDKRFITLDLDYELDPGKPVLRPRV